jgi:hypothetical protein
VLSKNTESLLTSDPLPVNVASHAEPVNATPAKHEAPASHAHLRLDTVRAYMYLASVRVSARSVEVCFVEVVEVSIKSNAASLPGFLPFLPVRVRTVSHAAAVVGCVSMNRMFVACMLRKRR